MKDLKNYFLKNKGKVIHKWLHYFPIYEKHFSQFSNKKVIMWEVGVYKGGSLQMWADYFGINATIIGLDIDTTCAEYEYDNPNIHIRIGDQANTEFLQKVLDEFGVPDIVLDDGGHYMHQMNTTFDHVYPKMKSGSVYMVEDTHCCYWPEHGGGVQNPNSFTNRCKNFIDLINAHESFYRSQPFEPNEFADTTFGMHIYDSVICFEKGTITERNCPAIGS